MEDQSGKDRPTDDSSGVVPYQLPGVELLDELTAADALQITADDLLATQGAIIIRLESLGVKVSPGDITCGCNVTRYEIYPEVGVSVEKIRQHRNDIAMALRSDRFNLMIPVPGKVSVGIEIPNQEIQKVTLRELLESYEWLCSEAKIPLLLGRNIESQPVVVDLDQLPHLLIAGNIGSGKSVGIHAMLACLLYRFAPWQLRLVIIDPDVLEMRVYNTVPHLYLPVITDTQKALLALKLVLEEIGRRSNLLSRADPEPFPVMVVIITELSPLLSSDVGDFEAILAQIAKVGHLVGVHLIIATRVLHPDVIRPILKLNIPSRVAFQVSKEKDSRLLLGEEGATQLLGQGDLFYRPPNSGALCRIQGTYINDEEIRRVIDFVSAQAGSNFVVPVLETNEVSDEDEELVQRCIEVMKEERKASTSLFQRRLRMGYTRAARIIDILEQRGYVGTGTGAEPRKILVDLDDLI